MGIFGCINNHCTIDYCNTEIPTSQPVKETILIRNVISEDFSSVTVTMCDYCGRWIAASDKQLLMNRMYEYGWRLTEKKGVICEECLSKRIVLRSGNYF